MQNTSKRVGIGTAAEILAASENCLRNNEVIAEDGKRYLVKGDDRIRVYSSPGGQRRYAVSDLEHLRNM